MIKHDQLIGLCDEIAALVRLKVPLEPSLRVRSRTLPRQLGERIARLAEQMESGRSLSEALKSDPTFPPVYAAVIESGLESGRLPKTLELLTHSMQTIRGTRHFLIRATLYPMFVFSVLWCVLTVILLLIAPRFSDFFADFSITMPLYDRLSICAERPIDFCLGMFGILAVIWSVYGLWCYISARSPLVTMRSSTGLFGLRRINRDLAKATFARMLGVSIESGVPLHRALALAFQAVGDPRWTKLSEENFETMTHRSSDQAEAIFRDKKKSPLSNIVHWAIGVPDREILLTGLRQFADMNELRAQNRMERLELWLPIALMACLGGVVLAAYLFSIVVPYGYVLYHLAAF